MTDIDAETGGGGAAAAFETTIHGKRISAWHRDVDNRGVGEAGNGAEIVGT